MVWFTTEAVGADCFRSYNGPAVVQLHPSFLEKLKDKKKQKKNTSCQVTIEYCLVHNFLKKNVCVL